MIRNIIEFTFTLLDHAHVSKTDNDEEVEDGDGADWNGETERERVPDERLLGAQYLAFGPLNSTRDMIVFFHCPERPHTDIRSLCK